MPSIIESIIKWIKYNDSDLAEPKDWYTDLCFNECYSEHIGRVHIIGNSTSRLGKGIALRLTTVHGSKLEYDFDLDAKYKISKELHFFRIEKL